MHSISVKLSPIALAVLDVSTLADGSWMINRINVPAAYRGQGHGSAMLSQICEKADSYGVDLVLAVNPYGELDRRALTAWYLRYGFRPTATGSGWLIRKSLDNRFNTVCTPSTKDSRYDNSTLSAASSIC